jgi:hypothetical protein
MRLDILTAIILSIGLFAIMGAAYFYSPVLDNSNNAPITYHSQVCIYKNNELVQCDHNLLYDAGKNLTRDALSLGGVGKVINISLCNGTAGCGTPVATASEGYTGFNSCGLAAGEGTLAVNRNSPGNWSVAKTFTSSCDNIVTNSTRLGNATMNQSGVGLPVDGLFAANTFSTVNLQNTDTLTVNWTIWIA